MILLDSNVLVRLASKADAQYAVANAAVFELRRRGQILDYATQVIAETWSVVTRPKSQRGGLGFAYGVALRLRRRAERILTRIPDPPDLYIRWAALINAHQIIGVNAHEARLVAVMQANGVGRILTFNTKDFQRYPGVTAIDPASV